MKMGTVLLESAIGHMAVAPARRARSASSIKDAASMDAAGWSSGGEAGDTGPSESYLPKVWYCL